MAFQNYALAVGQDNAAGLQNIENLFLSAELTQQRWGIVGEPVTPGAQARVTLDQQVTYTGIIIIRWRFSILPFANLSTLVTTFIGGFTTHSAGVTIRTRDDQNTFSNYNAVMALPSAGQDYQRAAGDYVRNLEITFRDLVAL